MSSYRIKLACCALLCLGAGGHAQNSPPASAPVTSPGKIKVWVWAQAQDILIQQGQSKWLSGGCTGERLALNFESSASGAAVPVARIVLPARGQWRQWLRTGGIRVTQPPTVVAPLDADELRLTCADGKPRIEVGPDVELIPLM